MKSKDSTHLPEEITTTPGGQRPADLMTTDPMSDGPTAPVPEDIIPDEVPRKDGPGGEDGQ